MDHSIRASEIIDQLQSIQLEIDWGRLGAALLVSLVAAFVASMLYRFFYERRATGSQVHRSFPLLAISITTLFICVQTSLPLSLGLLGALSIIRFRTPIKEPEEVGFIMLVIASSIAAATFSYLLIIILYVIAFATLVLMHGFSVAKWIKRDGLVVVTLRRDRATAQLPAAEKALAAATRRIRLENAASSGDVTTCQYIFSGLKLDAAALQGQLEQALGDAFVGMNLYLDRAGGFN